MLHSTAPIPNTTVCNELILRAFSEVEGEDGFESFTDRLGRKRIPMIFDDQLCVVTSEYEGPCLLDEGVFCLAASSFVLVPDRLSPHRLRWHDSPPYHAAAPRSHRSIAQEDRSSSRERRRRRTCWWAYVRSTSIFSCTVGWFFHEASQRSTPAIEHPSSHRPRRYFSLTHDRTHTPLLIPSRSAPC